MTNQTYSIFCKGKLLYSNLTEEEYFDAVEDLAAEFYLTGNPNPSDITTEIIAE